MLIIQHDPRIAIMQALTNQSNFSIPALIHLIGTVENLKDFNYESFNDIEWWEYLHINFKQCEDFINEFSK